MIMASVTKELIEFHCLFYLHSIRKRISHPKVFNREAVLKNFTQDRASFQLEIFRLQVRNFFQEVLHDHCFLNDFVQLCRIALTDCISFFATAKKWLRGLQNKPIPSKQIHYWIILTVLLLTLKMTFSVGTAHKILGSTSLDAFFCKPQMNRVVQFLKNLGSLLLKRLASLEVHRKMCLVKCNARNATGSRPKTYYPAIKEIVAIFDLSFLSDKVTLCTSYKP